MNNSFIDKLSLKLYLNLVALCFRYGSESNFIGLLWAPNPSIVTTNTGGRLDLIEYLLLTTIPTCPVTN
jgi:hypothetical protein